MRFQVPQFIEVEDKIFGPLTLKQFIYLAGGAGFSFLIYIITKSLVISLIPIVAVMALSAGLAFYKLYGHFPLISVLESAFKYYLGGKLYIWKKEEKPREEVAVAKNYASIMVPKVAGSKLKDLAWSLDIKESVYSDRKQK